jgi:tRNA(Ile)-lysidine synthase
MLERIEHYLRNQHLTDTDTLLVAVSAGVDSMSLLHALTHLNVKVAVAHCNYGLRGFDSDSDAALVQQFCIAHSIPFHATKFETQVMADASGASVQMVARNLRYSFFEGIMHVWGYSFTLLAHHADDRVESLLLNLIRGTGYRGLMGMPSKRGRFLRPMLSIRRSEIETYATENLVPFRSDASNQETKYRRNRVRLHLLPMLRLLAPDIDDHLIQLCESFERHLPAFEDRIAAEMHRLSEFHDGALRLDRNAMLLHPFRFTLTKELLRPMGFSSAQVHELLHLLPTSFGMLETGSHRLYAEGDAHVVVSTEVMNMPPELSKWVGPRSAYESLKSNHNTVLLDADLIDPNALTVRKWAAGDSLRPLGMKGSKNVSDLLTDRKLSPCEKDRTWVLTHGEMIVWVIGHRMDDRFKVTEKTVRVLEIKAGRS